MIFLSQLAEMRLNRTLCFCNRNEGVRAGNGYGWRQSVLSVRCFARNRPAGISGYVDCRVLPDTKNQISEP